MNTIKKIAISASALAILLGSASIAPILAATNSVPEVNLNSKPTNGPFGAFQLLQCDGPKLPSSMADYLAKFKAERGRDYRVCNFQGLMDQVQYLINAMIILGVVGAVVGFVYAGYLYITGIPSNISKAHAIFPKVFWGLILMLTAWFVVYQILEWLTGNASAYLGG